jgi:4-hydroxybenzoate polyprenyltransferase
VSFTDIPQGGLKNRLPVKLRAYIELARFDRPIGTWLLLFPCLWSLALSQSAGFKLYGLFAVGAIVMRAAGCVVNDIVDRKLDAEVERTKGRPLPSGRLSLKEAFTFLTLLLGLGLIVLLQLNTLAIELGVASLLLVAAYPFMKRITWWPQAFLGLTFNWGALLGWAAATGRIELPSVMLYIGGLAWTLGYDTIYAHQDKRDDSRIGVKSTARRFGRYEKIPVFAFYALAYGLIGVAGWLGGTDRRFEIILVLIAVATFVTLVRWRTGDPAHCLMLFKANAWIGLGIFAAIVVGMGCL